MRKFIVMSQARNDISPFWMGLVPLGIVITRGGRPVECPDENIEFSYRDAPDKIVTVGEVIKKAAEFAIIDILDENQKNITESIIVANEKAKIDAKNAAIEKIDQKFMAILDKRQDTVIHYINTMVDKFINNPAQAISNLKHFKALEKDNKNRKKIIETINKCLKQLNVSFEDATIKNKEGKEESDVVIIKGADAVTIG